MSLKLETSTSRPSSLVTRADKKAEKARIKTGQQLAEWVNRARIGLTKPSEMPAELAAKLPKPVTQMPLTYYRKREKKEDLSFLHESCRRV